MKAENVKITIAEFAKMLGHDPVHYKLGEIYRIGDKRYILVPADLEEKSHSLRLELWALLKSPPDMGNDLNAWMADLDEHVSRLQSLVLKHRRVVNQERKRATPRKGSNRDHVVAKPHKDFPTDPLAMAKRVVSKMPK